MATDRDVAFPRLSTAELVSLFPYGRQCITHAGDELFAEGERAFAFFVVLEGSVEILEHSSGAPRTIAVHETGEFTGDADMVSGAALVSVRVRDSGRVLAIPPAELLRLVDELPQIGERVLKAFLVRRLILIGGGFEAIKIVGSRCDSLAHRLRDSATRNAIPFTWLDVGQD